MKTIQRSEVIDALLDDDLDISSIMDREEYMYDILREGFKGYNKYTNKELKQEYEARIDPEDERVTVVGRR